MIENENVVEILLQVFNKREIELFGDFESENEK